MVGQGDPSSIKHLQEEIPNQSMGLFDLIEKQDASPMARENFPKSPRAAGFASHEQLHAVQMKKLGHIEAEKIFGAEEILCEFERQLRLPHSGRPEKKERAKRFPSRGCNPSWPRSRTEHTREMTWFCPLIQESKCASRPFKSLRMAASFWRLLIDESRSWRVESFSRATAMQRK